jgi:hypothetical protein
VSRTGDNKRRFEFSPWLKKLGVGGFVFFLVKGLAWLLVPIIIAKSCAG